MWYLVVYFLISGSWQAGDLVFPDGWSSTTHKTEEKCLMRKEKLNEALSNSDLADKAKGHCQTKHPLGN